MFEIFIFLAGIIFVIFGGGVLFSNKFLALMERTLWKETDADKKFFPGKTGYFYQRYARGLTSFIVGIVLIVLFIYSQMK